MPPVPWKRITVPNGISEYLALLSFLPLKHYRTIPLFFWLTFQTQRQLSHAQGLIGYSLQAQPLRRQFWTLSAWEDQQALMQFVREAPHGKIMQMLAPHMGKTQFVQWKVKASDIPLNWDAAKRRPGPAWSVPDRCRIARRHAAHHGRLLDTSGYFQAS